MHITVLHDKWGLELTLFDYMHQHPLMTLALAFLIALVAEQFARRQ